MSAFRSTRSLFRASILTSMRYRSDFFFAFITALLSMGFTIVPLWVLAGSHRSIAGFSFDELLLVTAWFALLKSMLDGVLTPSTIRSIERIGNGSFDFVLLKPADPQLLATFSSVNVFSAIDFTCACIYLSLALHRMHHLPTAREAALALALTFAAMAILYSISTLVLSAAFYVPRIDNLVHMLVALFEPARWPSTVYHGFAHVLFTFVLPLGLMTTFPALALAGHLPWSSALLDVGAAVFAIVFSRFVFSRAISAYTSAGG